MQKSKFLNNLIGSILILSMLCLSGCGANTDAVPEEDSDSTSVTTEEKIKIPEDTESDNDLLEVERLLQGVWYTETAYEAITVGEIFAFDNGAATYYTYTDSMDNVDKAVPGTYEVTESYILATINGHENYLDYNMNNGVLELSFTADSGADAGKPRIYTQLSQGNLSEDYTPGQSSSGNSGSYSQSYSNSSNSKGNSSSGTFGEEQALEKAWQYLDFMAFSYTGIIDQLKYEGFTSSEATYAADNCGADWYEQAYKKGQEYLDYSSFSKQSLYEQLVYEGFTNDQAESAVNRLY